MPYFMYPRIYNSFYKKIYIHKKPNFNLRVFFSGSVVIDGYSTFFWKKEPEKFPNRILIINKIPKIKINKYLMLLYLLLLVAINIDNIIFIVIDNINTTKNINSNFICIFILLYLL